jgi:hypothetical protein
MTSNNKYTYEYDNCGVLCRYNEELAEWECCECHCLNCGYSTEECDCETGFEEAPFINDVCQQHKPETKIDPKSKCKQDKSEYDPKTIDDKVICSENEENHEKLTCSYCGRDEDECEKNTDSEKNPITQWISGWGMSCDDCYYKNNPDTDEDSEEIENCV